MGTQGPVQTTATPPELIEREAELAIVEEACDAALEGRGALVVVEGPPGIGKTALSAAAVRAARLRGMLALAARGGALERDFAFGVTRQLLEPPLAEADPDTRDALLSGAARSAASVLGASDSDQSAPPGPLDDGHAAVHGLYWVVGNLAAARGPLLLLIDDSHWADAASLRFALHLARRLDDLPVVLVVAGRPPAADAQGELVEAISAEPLARMVRLEPLSVDGVGALLEERLGGYDPELTAACHQATAGNPFLVGALASALTPLGLNAGGPAAERVRALAPEAVARSVLARVRATGPDAVALARAVAVLESARKLRHAAELAGLDLDAAAAAADELARADVLAAERPLAFVHPIVRTALYDDIPAGERARLHARAARLLADDDAEADQIASHLMASEPADDPWAVDRLLDVATHALAHGAPEAAAAYARRALDEPPSGAQRVTVLRLLGRAEGHVRDPHALDCLREAHLTAASVHQRAEIALELGRALVLASREEEVRALWDATIAELGDGDRELARRLHGERWIVDRAAGRPRDDGKLLALEEEATDDTPAGRALLAVVAFERATRGDDAGVVAALAERALAGGELLAAEGAEGQPFFLAANALYLSGRLEEAHRAFTDAAADAAERGSALGFRFASAFRSHVALPLGHISDAVADARLSLATEGEDRHCVRWATAGFLIEALIEREELETARAALEATRLHDPFPDHIYAFVLMRARGCLRVAEGDVEGGLHDLLWVGRRAEAMGSVLGVLDWRPAAARAAAALGHGPEARSLATEEVERAQTFGAPRTLGAALRAAGHASSGQRRIKLLREAVEALESSPARLELAHAQLDLGAALREADKRSAAREPLRAALDLAFRCGARAVAGRAREELVAAGARPRRAALTGRDALTPSERRVAEMAASGLANRDIAQALFVTGKTVEVHLSSVYRKLGLRSRAELGAALGG